MSADRELLEMAAKAAGREIGREDQGDPIDRKFSDCLGLWCVGPWPGWFNPLNNDGDALRLATRLRMSVSTGPCIAAANTIEGALRGAFFKESTVGVNHDAAVRRVIVQAAAEIGKHIP